LGNPIKGILRAWTIGYQLARSFMLNEMLKFAIDNKKTLSLFLIFVRCTSAKDLQQGYA